MKKKTLVGAVAAAACGLGSAASANVVFNFSDGAYPGLSAQADFTLLDATTIQIVLTNTSTGAPAGFDEAGQILTGISWDFEPAGLAMLTQIVGGSVLIGPGSQSVNFSTGTYGPGTDVSGEYGFGNMDGTGALPNFVSSNTAQATPFGGANLDGPASNDGPQGGLIANPAAIPLSGLGAIQNQVVMTVNLSDPISDLDFLAANGVRVEFGSDAAFITVPGPGTAASVLGVGLLAFGRRRRRGA